MSREKAAEHRTQLAAAAGRLFRTHGIDAVGVADIAKAAALSQGALYSHFPSKAALAVEAFREGQDASAARVARALGPAPALDDIVSSYVSARQRDNMEACCPMLATASEAARQNDAFKEEFADAFRALAATLQGAMERAGAPESRPRSLASAAMMVGAVAIARALAGPDLALSDELLAAARAAIGSTIA